MALVRGLASRYLPTPGGCDPAVHMAVYHDDASGHANYIGIGIGYRSIHTRHKTAAVGAGVQAAPQRTRTALSGLLPGRDQAADSPATPRRVTARPSRQPSRGIRIDRLGFKSPDRHDR
jgi:hypothetical protein